MYDVVIVGGGFVGLALANGLAGFGFRCALIDKKKITLNNKDGRGIALAKSSINVLENLNIWNDLSASAYLIEKVHVSKQGRFGITTLQAEDPLGFLVDADILQEKLYLTAQQGNIDLFFQAQELNFKLDDTWQINFSVNGEIKTIDADLLVAADGSNSAVCQKVGIRQIKREVSELALVSNIYIEKEHQNVAYERFTDQGIIALLPNGYKKMKFVWTLQRDLAQKMLALSGQDLLAEVQDRFGYRLGKLQKIDDIVSYPLSQSTAEKIIDKRLLVVGNAANTMHPVAAQGLNLGLRDVRDFLRVIRTDLATDLGSEHLLLKYSQLRKRDHWLTQKFTMKVQSIFTKEYMFSKQIGSMGLIMANLCRPLNQRIINFGLGNR